MKFPTHLLAFLLLLMVVLFISFKQMTSRNVLNVFLFDF